MKIISVKGRWILDSRGNPTVEADLFTDKGIFTASVPSGASTGIYEAVELRDKEKDFHGKGVIKAIKNIDQISGKIKGMKCNDQEKIDQVMRNFDNTKNKSKLGANAILAVSIAAAKAGAASENKSIYKYISEMLRSRKHKIKLPVPFSNIINGGIHADTGLAIQEFMIAPYKAESFSEGIKMVSEVYQDLKKNLHKYGSTNVGDEGGFAPKFTRVREALDAIQESVEECGYSENIGLAIDAAASEFYDSKLQKYKIDNSLKSQEEMVNFYSDLAKSYNIISIEDGFDQDDWEGFSLLNEEIGKRIQVIGDDLTVTNTERISTAIKKQAINTLLLKLNQIGTVSESLESARLCYNNNVKVMASHRSGETEDTFLADFAVGIGCGELKSGAPCRSERTAKYNRILRIEEELGKKAEYAAW